MEFEIAKIVVDGKTKDIRITCLSQSYFNAARLVAEDLGISWDVKLDEDAKIMYIHADGREDGIHMSEETVDSLVSLLYSIRGIEELGLLKQF